MSLLAPISLLLGLLAVPIVLLYMLRLRRKDVAVSSTMLWQRLLRDKEANAPWQRLRRNLLLIIQLLILALLVFALARPYLPVPSLTTGSVVVLLDGSASMMAEEADSDRFSLARREVARLIDDLSRDSQMTLILVGSTPHLLASGDQDRSVLHEALAQAQAAPVSADWSAAFALAAGAAQGFQDGRVVLVSDGGLPEQLPPMPAELIYLPIGSTEENLAITALSSREDPDGAQLFASVTNFGRLPQETLFSLLLDNELFDARRINVPGGETTNLTWTLPEGSPRIDAVLSDTAQDHLPIDDRAWAVHEGGRDRRVLLVTDGNRFLETAMSIMPVLEVFKVSGESWLNEIGEDEYDLVVLDSIIAPRNLPNVGMLIIDPLAQATDTASPELTSLSTGEVFTNTNVIRLEDSPLLRFVDWSAVNVRSAREIDAPWARPLVEAEAGPLLLAGERGGRRTVIVTFRLQDSDLPLQIAFPIVMANIMDWLEPGGLLMDETDFAPGEPVLMGADSGAETIVVRKPNGEMWTHEADETALVFPETSQLGLYEIMARSLEGERLVGRFTVNMNSAAESKITPATAEQFGFSYLDTGAQASSDGSNVGQREFWPWFAVLALVVLMVEWWVYHQGARLPNRDDWLALTRSRNG